MRLGSYTIDNGAFTFVKEDLEGTNPKFVVTDKDGVRWKAKLGKEARPETVPSRMAWAVGYHANEVYFLPELQVSGMPARLHRGQKLVGPDGSVRNVRLKRESADGGENRKLALAQQYLHRLARAERAQDADGGAQQLGLEGPEQCSLPAGTQ